MPSELECSKLASTCHDINLGKLAQNAVDQPGWISNSEINAPSTAPDGGSALYCPVAVHGRD
jgi:hypothetical protein